MTTTQQPPPHILVVEDDPDVRKLLQLELELEGFKVSVARTGAEGLEAVRAVKPDAVILDAMLPELGGFHVLRELKSDENTASIPVIYLSARTDTAEGRLAVEAGAARFFPKPFEPAELVEELRSVLGSADS